MKQTKVIRKYKRRGKSKRLNKKVNKSKKIDKRKRHNKTKKLRGGMWPFSSSDNKITSLSDAADTAENKGDKLEKGLKDATNAAGVVISVLASSGVGLPLAGALTAILFVANSMTKMAIANKKLIAALLDVLNIVTHCDKLNSTMKFILEVFDKNKNIQKLDMDPEITKRLETKLNNILTFLVNLSTNEMLDVLSKDKQLNDKVKELIQAEVVKRKDSNIFERAKNTSMRVLDRTVKAETKINEILRELTMINGYFMLMKSQFDMIIQRHERVLSDDDKKNIWLEIEAKQMGDDNKDTNRYNNYLSLDTHAALEKVEAEAVKVVNTTDDSDGKIDAYSDGRKISPNEVLPFYKGKTDDKIDVYSDGRKILPNEVLPFYKGKTDVQQNT